MNDRRMKKKRRTRRDVEALLGRYHQSNVTARAFAEAEGVATSSLYKWLRTQRAIRPTPDLVEVTPAVNPGGEFAIQTPQGYRVEVPVNFLAGDLKRLLGVLEA